MKKGSYRLMTHSSIDSSNHLKHASTQDSSIGELRCTQQRQDGIASGNGRAGISKDTKYQTTNMMINLHRDGTIDHKDNHAENQYKI